MRTPLATYRVQLHPGFTFDDLAALVPALHSLGVSDVYCSPIFRPTPGSLHGYDVCDYELVNPELGGEAGLRRLSARLREQGMGLLLDFVPNHMGIDGPHNRWWRDVLEHGRASAYAAFFDIHWNDQAAPGRARVFAPLLPEHYGVLLEQGKLRLVHEDGALALAHEGTRFPLRPETYGEIVQRIAPHLTEGHLPAPPADPLLMKAHLEELLARTPAARVALDDCLRHLNGRPGDPSSFDELDRLIDAQHYRLARWQAGAHGTNYRRFFAIDTLVALRMEDAAVFEAVHARLRDFIREAIVTGLRIDHIDGLRDPQGYLERLQALARESAPASAAPGAGFYVVVEKILAPDEPLPVAWVAAGTTGYEFVADLAGLLADPRHERAFDEIYAEFTGIREGFAEVVQAKKRLVLDEMFANTVLMLAQTLQERVHVDRRWRDLTIPELAGAIHAMLAGFRIYRTYRRRGEAAQGADREEINHAAAAALALNPRIEPAVVHFVRDCLLGDYPEAGAFPPHREAVNDWALGFQQYTGAVTAKAVEDTTYYTFNRLVALNEVGGEPAHFGAPVSRFHEANRARLARAPGTLLTTSTHDTKMSEDVRARLLALSEIPWEWRAWLEEWRTLNAPAKTEVGGRLAPDADEEYRLYQMLLGAWPLPPAEIDDVFRERITAHLRKAVSEAKVNTSILHPNEPWLAACDRFVATILAPGSAFVASLRLAADRLARLGLVNSLAQVALKLAVPGVPDIYQGNESWDFSLVDPDNRRAVDHAARQALAARLYAGARPRDLLADWEDGGVKLALTRALLRFRRERPELFARGAYEAVEFAGARAAHAVGFLRSLDGEHLLVVAARLAATLAWPPVGAVWRDTHLVLPEACAGLVWRDLVTVGAPGAELADGRLSLESVLAEWPVAVLHARAG